MVGAQSASEFSCQGRGCGCVPHANWCLTLGRRSRDFPSVRDTCCRKALALEVRSRTRIETRSGLFHHTKFHETVDIPGPEYDMTCSSYRSKSKGVYGEMKGNTFHPGAVRAVRSGKRQA